MLAATILASLAFVTEIAPQESTRVMRTIPVGDIIRSHTNVPRARFGSMLVNDGDYVAFVRYDESERGVSRGFLTELVGTSVARNTDGGEDDFVAAVINSRLALAGSRDSVNLAVELVELLDATVARSIVVEARLFADGGEADTRLGPEETRRLLGARARWQARSTTRSGEPTVLEQARYSPYLMDCDTEVAQDQSISDPLISTMFEGVQLVVEPHAVPGSDELVLFCSACIGEAIGDFDVRSTGVNQMAALDVPRVANNQVTFSGRIADGGALVVTFAGAESAGSRFGLVVSASSGARSVESSKVRAFPISALTSRSLATIVRPRHARSVGSDHTIFPLLFEDEDSTISPDTVFETLGYVLQPQMDSGEFDVMVVGGWLLCFGESDVLESARNVLATMHDDWIRSASCELVSSIDRLTPDSDGIFAGSSEPAASSELHRVRMPVILGRPHFAIRGIESTVIHDIAVEIAQEASATDPVVGLTFGGIFAELVVHDGIGGLRPDVNVELAHVARAERRAAETRHGGDLYLAKSGRAHLHHSGLVDDGEVVELGDGGTVMTDGHRFRVRQAMRIDRH